MKDTNWLTMWENQSNTMVRRLYDVSANKKEIPRRRYHYYSITCRKLFQKIQYWKYVQGCISGAPSPGGRNISRKLNFPTKQNVLPSDKSSTQKINQQASFKTKTQNCSEGELTSKKTESDIINNNSQKLRSERTVKLDTIKLLPKIVTRESIKYFYSVNI